MLRQRIITAAIGIPFLIVIVWFGDPWFSLLIAAAAVAGTVEFYRLGLIPKSRSFLAYFGILWALVLVLSPHFKEAVVPVITIATVISLVGILLSSPREKSFLSWAWMVAGVIYVGWMLSYWLNLRILDDGRAWVYLAIFTTFANDSGAFFVGRKWGRHQLSPAISPGKTWEGTIAGLLSAVIGAIIIGSILSHFSLLSLKQWQIVLLAFLISIFAQLGDLIESLLKRNAGVKDSGKLLPGHGGILDRCDSFIFTGAVVYYYIIFAL